MEIETQEELALVDFYANAQNVIRKGKRVASLDAISTGLRQIDRLPASRIGDAAQVARTLLSSARNMKYLDLRQVEYLHGVIENAGHREIYSSIPGLENKNPALALERAQHLLESEVALQYFSDYEIDYLDSVTDAIGDRGIVTAYGVVHDAGIAGLLGGSIEKSSKPIDINIAGRKEYIIQDPFTVEEQQAVKPLGLGHMLRSMLHLGEFPESNESVTDLYHTVKSALQDHPQYNGQE